MSSLQSNTDNIYFLYGFKNAPQTVKNVVYLFGKINLHVLGHANITCMGSIIYLNGIWNESVEGVLADTVGKYTSCRTAALPQPSIKVSIKSLYRNFNDVVCIDHFYVYEVALFHVMDGFARFSASL